MEAPVGKAPSFANRPKALVCHICGREFGTKSLTIHQKSCAQKWEQAEALKPKHLRRPLPTAPSLDPLPSMSREELEKRNQKAMDTFEKQAMKQCPNCFRTFLEDRLDVHLRSCTAEKPHKPVSRIKEAPQPPTGETAQLIPERENAQPPVIAPEQPSAEALRASFQQLGHRTSLEDFQEAEKEAEMATEQEIEPISEEVRSDLEDEAPPEFADESLTEAVDSRAEYYAMGVFSPKRKPKIPVPVELQEEEKGGDSIDLQLEMIACGSCGQEFPEDQVISHEIICRKAREIEDLQVEKPSADPVKVAEVIEVSVKRPQTATVKINQSENSKTTQLEVSKTTPPEAVSTEEASPKVIKAKVLAETRETATITPTKSRVSSRPTTGSSVPSTDLVPCPHCGRKFAPDAASRHISICQDVRNRPKAPSTLLTASVRSSLPNLPSESLPRSPVSRSHLDSTTLLKGTEECPNCHGLISGILLASHLKVCRPAPNPAKTERRTVERVAQSGGGLSFCASCGEKYLPEAKFCIVCGAKR